MAFTLAGLLAQPRHSTKPLEKGRYKYHGLILPDPEVLDTGVLFFFPEGVVPLCLAHALAEDDLPIADPAFQEQVFATLRGIPLAPAVVRYLQPWEKRSHT